MCYIFKVFCQACKRWIGENKIQLCKVGVTGTIYLPLDAKLVSVFTYDNKIRIVNLSKARILTIIG